MKFFQAAFSELISLFVDDWAFALLLVGWVLLLAFAGPHLPVNVTGPLFFLGISLLVLTAVARRAKR